MASDRERMELLADAAELYYVQGYSQAEIASRLGYSRSAISRFLTEARDQGVVEFRVHHTVRRWPEYEYALTHRYDLRRVFVIRSGQLEDRQVLRLLGRQGASYLGENLTEESILAISWGTAVHEVAQAVRPKALPGLVVVQMIGSMGYSDPGIDGPEVARAIADAYSGRYVTLNSPVLVFDRGTRDALLKEQQIQEVLSLAVRADYFLVGIGSAEPTQSGLVRAGYLAAREMESLKGAGAVGDIASNLFDSHGRYQDFAFNDRLVGINLQQLSAAGGLVVGVAGGKVKAKAILGAMRGRLIDILVTDDRAAEEILTLDPI